MWNYLANHKRFTYGLIIAIVVLAILMWILFQSIQAAGAVILCAVFGFAMVWLWQLGDE
ncbi:MAG: hypothetical protein H6839_04195 [Planctomycetes bacterium]|nr:hypothetical protein [Planctomycetota bacterium]